MTLTQVDSRVDSGRVEHDLPLVVLVVGEDGDWVEAWLQSQIQDALSLRPEELVIDLAQCEVLSSALLRLLLSTHRQLRQRDGRLTMRGVSPRLTRIIGLGGLSNVFDVEEVPAR